MLHCKMKANCSLVIPFICLSFINEQNISKENVTSSFPTNKSYNSTFCPGLHNAKYILFIRSFVVDAPLSSKSLHPPPYLRKHVYRVSHSFFYKWLCVSLTLMLPSSARIAGELMIFAQLCFRRRVGGTSSHVVSFPRNFTYDYQKQFP